MRRSWRSGCCADPAALAEIWGGGRALDYSCAGRSLRYSRRSLRFGADPAALGTPAGCDIYDFSYYSCPDGDSGPVDEDGGLPPGDGDGSGNEENPGEIAEENLPQAEPDCSVPIDSMPTAIKTWCFGRFPAGIELEKLQTAIGRLNGMGGPCVTIAQKFEQMLADSAVKIFTPQRGWPGGASTLGGDWLTIADGWLTTWEEEWTPAGRNLPSTITHEVDHVLRHVDPTSTTTDRRGHLIENGYLNEYHTMNSKTCR